MEYSDLPAEAQEAFDQAESDFEGSIDEAVRQKYVQGLERSVENQTYRAGLANRFNMDESDFAGVAGKWASTVDLDDADVDFWQNQLEGEGIPQKFKENLVIGLTETTE